MIVHDRFLEERCRYGKSFIFSYVHCSEILECWTVSGGVGGRQDVGQAVLPFRGTNRGERIILDFTKVPSLFLPHRCNVRPLGASSARTVTNCRSRWTSQIACSAENKAPAQAAPSMKIRIIMTMKQSLYEPDYALECPPIWLLVEREMHGRLFCLLLSILPREWRAGMTASEYQADAFDAVIAWLCTGISIPSPGTYRESSSCTVAQPVLRQKPWLGQFFSAVLTKAALQMPSPRRSLKCPGKSSHIIMARILLEIFSNEGLKRSESGCSEQFKDEANETANFCSRQTA
nr:hypothetical protein CFP56_48827 [Quercus suber]